MWLFNVLTKCLSKLTGPELTTLEGLFASWDPVNVMLGHGSKLHFMEHMKWFTQQTGWIIYNVTYWSGLWCPVLNSWSFFVPFLIPCTCLPPYSATHMFDYPACWRCSAVAAAVLVATWDDSSCSPHESNSYCQSSPYHKFPFLLLGSVVLKYLLVTYKFPAQVY